MTATELALACAMALPLAAADRPGVLMSGTGELNGAMVRFTTVAEPPLSGGQWSNGGIAIRRDRIHRYTVDGSTHEYFGYDLVVEPGGAPGRYSVRIEPLSLAARDLKLGSHAYASTPLLLPRYPPAQTIESGDTIALDLLASPDGRQKIVDYIQIETRRDPVPAASSAQPRDFTLDDGPLTFEFKLPTQLLRNGQPYSGQLGMTGKPGGTLWFSIPGRGRYVLSLQPHEGFQRAGAIRENALTFQAGGEQYELRTSGPVLPSGGAWNLYVLHDPQFPARDYVQYGTDRLSNLLPKR
jgi:hypothetical protein